MARIYKRYAAADVTKIKSGANSIFEATYDPRYTQSWRMDYPVKTVYVVGGKTADGKFTPSAYTSINRTGLVGQKLLCDADGRPYTGLSEPQPSPYYLLITDYNEHQYTIDDGGGASG